MVEEILCAAEVAILFAFTALVLDAACIVKCTVFNCAIAFVAFCNACSAVGVAVLFDVTPVFAVVLPPKGLQAHNQKSIAMPNASEGI